MSNTEKSYELTALEKSNVVKFKVTTSKKYHALTEVDTTCIYFLVDTREIYKGGLSFSDAIIKCYGFPARPINGKIYYNMVTNEIKYYNPDTSDWLTLFTPMATSLTDEDVDYDNYTVNGTAIKKYIDKKFKELYEAVGKQPAYNTVPIFNSYEDAKKYAETSAFAKPGMCITAPNGENDYVMYVIQNDRSLVEYPSMDKIKELIAWKTE